MASAGSRSSYRRAKKNRIVHKIDEIKSLKKSLCDNIERFSREACQEAISLVDCQDKKQLNELAFQSADNRLESCIIKLTNLLELFKDDEDEDSTSDGHSVNSESDDLSNTLASSLRLEEQHVELQQPIDLVLPSASLQPTSFEQENHATTGHQVTSPLKSKHVLRPDIQPFIPKSLALIGHSSAAHESTSTTDGDVSQSVEVDSVNGESDINVRQSSSQLNVIVEEDVVIAALDVSVGDELVCFITHIESPSLFYLRILDSGDMELIVDDLNFFYKKLDRPLLVSDASQLKLGMACCVLESAMNDWKRAVITGIRKPHFNNADYLVTVLHVDSGDSEELPLNRVYKLENQFISVRRQAIPCSLTGCEKVQWTKSNISLFKRVLNTSLVRAVIVHADRPTKSVDLFFADSMTGPTSVDDKKENVSETFHKYLAAPDDMTLTSASETRIVEVLEQGMMTDESKEELAISEDPSLAPSQKTFSFQIRSTSVPTLHASRPQCFGESDNENGAGNDHVDESIRGPKNPNDDVFATHSTSSEYSVESLEIPALLFDTDEPSRSFMAFLATIKDPWHFYVHPMTMEAGKIDELRDDLQKTYANSAPPLILEAKEKFTVGSYWCCRNHDDGEWHRGKILDTMEFQSSPKDANKKIRAAHVTQSTTKIKVHVHFIDWGDSVWLDIDELRILYKRFYELPALAVKCRLANVERANQPDGVWSSKSIKMFQDFIGDEPITLKIVKDAMADDDQHLNVLLYKNEVLLNDAILTSGLLEKKAHETGATNGRNNEAVVHKSPGAGNEWSVDITPEDETFSNFDPMQEEFTSQRNSYQVDVDDAGVALTGYKARDESEICLFYQRGTWCRRGNNCPNKHISPSKDGRTTDTKIIPHTVQYMELPEPKTNVAVEVTAILSPNHFYVNFPLGTAESINNLPIDYSLPADNLYALVDYMQAEYKKGKNLQGDYLLRSAGELVAAKYSLDDQWYRARVLDRHDKGTMMITVCYVDYGTCEVVPEQDVRDIDKKFLHLPLQAVECSLAGIRPIDGNEWSDEAKKLFARLTIGKNIVAHVVQIIEDRIVVNLTVLTETKNKFDVNLALVNAKLARHETVSKAEA